MRSTTVAFRGVNQVVSAYANNDMPAWSIWSGKEMMFAYCTDDVEEGKNMLRATLKDLFEGGSEAQFSLRVYEDAPTGGKIKSNTPWDRSFSFVLYGDEEYSPYRQGRMSYSKEADEKIQLLQGEIDALKLQLAEAEETEEKPEGISGILSGIMEMPGIKQALAAKLAGFINSVIPFNGPVPAAVAGLPSATPGQPIPSLLDSVQQAKVQQAINVLCTKDAKLGDHLVKLAEMAVSNIKQYNGLAAML
jgi:hypothetical protein